MAPTLIEALAGHAAGLTADRVPPEALHEAKRLILDSIGCALAATEDPKGRIGIDYGRQIGAGRDEATVFATGERLSVLGAAFANGEMISALDYDAILPPGHVSPYVVPAALATAEHLHRPGSEVVLAMVLAHDISHRLGKAMDYLRDIKDGEVRTPRVFGYSSTIFGSTAAILRVKGAGAGVMAQALGIAGCTAPVNSHIPWMRHLPTTTIKYTMAGGLAQSALAAAALGELGHRGDLQILDDRDHGFPAMIGTTRWEPSRILDGLGVTFPFVRESSIKPYPHCRVLHNVFDVLRAVQDQHDIRPDEITAIRAYGEAFVQQPIWQNTQVTHVQDGQFSIAHGIALAAHRVPPGKAWQSPDLIWRPSVLALMQHVTHMPHPDYVRLLADNPASRPARVEIDARGTTFSGEKRYPKGSPSPDPDSYLTDDELVAKFMGNAQGVVARDRAERVCERIMALETVADFAEVTALLRPAPVAVARRA